MTRDAKRLHQIAEQTPPWKDPWRRGESHHYQSMPPIGAVSGSATIATEDRQILLCPIHLDRPMSLRAVYFAGGAVGGDFQVATAIYRAQIPRQTKVERLDDPALGVTFRLIAPLGVTSVALTDYELWRHALTRDVLLDDGIPTFFAMQIGDASATRIYGPAANALGVCALIAASIPASFGEWPEETAATLNTRARLPYFVLRSATGVKLYSDPVLG
jgi:hypothetical protein